MLGERRVAERCVPRSTPAPSRGASPLRRSVLAHATSLQEGPVGSAQPGRRSEVLRITGGQDRTGRRAPGHPAGVLHAAGHNAAEASGLSLSGPARLADPAARDRSIAAPRAGVRFIRVVPRIDRSDFGLAHLSDFAHEQPCVDVWTHSDYDSRREWQRAPLLRGQLRGSDARDFRSLVHHQRAIRALPGVLLDPPVLHEAAAVQ